MPKTKYISLLDVVGPVMIGPSSSHTAGAAKIGYEAFKILGEPPTKIRIKLFNSFSDTGRGHKTDLAVLGGCLGIDPSDEKITQADQIATRQKVDFKIKWGYHSSDFHPNTALINLEGATKRAGVVGYSIGGGRIIIPRHFCRPLNEKTSDHEDLEAAATTSQTQLTNDPEKYFSMADLKKQATTGRQLLQFVLDVQAKQDQTTPEAILAEFTTRWQVMIQSILKGVRSRQRAQDQMFGGDSYRIRRSKLNILSQVLEDGLTYSIGVAEHNARMGKIVAAPTAGSCGIIPGTLRAIQEKFQFPDGKMAEALVIASAVGAIVADKVALAGAVAGCQAEIGVAGAMAAAAGVYLLGGRVDEIEAGASFVLANVLGLTCDPVMGKVEVPCILRNPMISAMAFAAIELALDNVKYTIPFDEVVLVMKKVGEDMHEGYKETSLAGLAKTKTARLLCRGCNRC